MYEKGFRTFVEVGPNNILTSFTEDILGDRQRHMLVEFNVGTALDLDLR